MGELCSVHRNLHQLQALLSSPYMCMASAVDGRGIHHTVLEGALEEAMKILRLLPSPFVPKLASSAMGSCYGRGFGP